MKGVKIRKGETRGIALGSSDACYALQPCVKHVVAAAGDYSRARLESYLQRIGVRFGPRGTGGGVADRLPAAARRAVGRMLLASSWFARHVVLDRWFLNAAQPPLAEFASAGARPAAVR